MSKKSRRRTPRATRSKQSERRLRVTAAVLGLTASLALCALALFGWSFVRTAGRGRVVSFEVLPGESTSSLLGRLSAEGLLSSPRLFSAYVRVLRPGLDPAPGPHLLEDALSARELLKRLERSPSRGSVRVVIPEGFNHVQLSERLHRLGVCDARHFQRAARDPELARKLGIPADGAEGYLFPATYELLVDSAPSAVVTVLATQALKRLSRLQADLAAEFERSRAEHGFAPHDVVVLASIIEREAARAEEKPLIASVFLNRLSEPSFRPLRMLQSDPTAAYGCLVLEPAPKSCSAGRPTPAMLRDASNLYNTYRHPGLPPGPISSPGEAALRAVLTPARTDYLYFVTQGGGRHRFSRTFAEHRSAIEGSP